jgi:hypothetical protein
MPTSKSLLSNIITDLEISHSISSNNNEKSAAFTKATIAVSILVTTHHTQSKISYYIY